MVTSQFVAGRLVLSLGTCAARLMGHSTIQSLVTWSGGPITSSWRLECGGVAPLDPLDGQAWARGGNEWVTGPSSPRLDVTVTTASTSDPSLVSWLYAPHGSDCRFLRDKGQSTVSGITWTSFVCSHAFRCVSHGGMGSLSTGLPSGRGSGRCTLA
jgi:hypothetical protein